MRTMRSFLLALLCALALPAALASAQTATTATQQRYLLLAQQGVGGARAHWWDRRLRWYAERLGAPGRFPLATIWDAVPLFESLDDVALAAPTRANLAAVNSFAAGAERYWDKALAPHGGFAPYPGDRGRNVQSWFDDNGWWALAFVDAYRATGRTRYVGDARRAFNYILAAGWDPVQGGLWWDTTHDYKAGESLGAATWLAAELYGITHSARYLAAAQMLQSWGTAHLWDAPDGLFGRSGGDSTPMPYVEGAFIAADDALCQSAAGSWCASAAQLTASTLRRFPTLQMGPQYDAIYLRALLQAYAATHDAQLWSVANGYADEALAFAGGGSGLYLRAWDGSSILQHDAVPGMLQTHAATVSLLAALATVAPPS